MNDLEQRSGSIVPPGVTDVVVIYVAQPGGPPDPRVGREIIEILEAQNEPLLHVTFTPPGGGPRRTTLMGLEILSNRGLPTDYDTLVQMFPTMKWSAR